MNTQSPPSQKAPSITAWPTASGITYGQTLASSTLTGGMASTAGTFAWTTPTTAPAAGAQSESVTFTPTDTTDYTTAVGSVSVTVAKATPTIATLPTASAITYGQMLSSSTLSGGAGSVSGTFAFTAPTTVPSAGMQSESVTFTASDAADYNTATGSVTVTVNQATPTISWSTPTAIMYGTALGSAQLDATASVPGTLAYSPASGKILQAGQQTLSVIFTPTDATDYGTAKGSVILTVNKATPTITAPPTASAISSGQPLSSSTLTGGTASVTGTFAWTSPSTVPSQGTDSESVTFTPTDTTDYNTAAATVSVTVNPPAPAGVAVDFGTTYQTINGFGGSTAWLGPLTTAQASELFSPTVSASSLGLSILRVRIDPEGTATGGGKFGDPYETSQWDDELTNAKEAVAANSNAIVFASPWTPPAAWKLNGSATFTDPGSTVSYNESFASTCSDGTGYCGGYLDPNHYTDYAAYLGDFVNFFNTNSGGINLYAISMQNEPDWNTTYESCIWSPDQMDNFVASLSGPSALGALLIMPESLNFNPNQAKATLTNPNAVNNVSIIGGHLYGVSPSAYPFPTGVSKPLWMTEHATCESSCPASSVNDALASATEVYNAMTVGNYSAYVWWWIWNDPNDGVNYGLIDSSTTSPTPTYYGYGIGQYSKFIQPGYVRVSATANSTTNVFVSAYTGTAGGTQHYVIVAINANTTSEALAFTLSNGTVTSVTPYQTTSAGGLAAQSAVTVTGGQFNYTLPAQSITTFVQ